VKSVRKALSVRNIGAFYVLVAVVVVFSLLSDVFFTSQTAKAILNQNSVAALVALSLIVPLASGHYDLSVGYTFGFGGVLVATLLQHTSMSPVECGLITLAACVGIGLLNSIVVIGLGVHSFIGTLGTGGMIAALTLAVSDNQTVTGRVGGDFGKLALTEFGGLTLPVFYVILIALALGYWLERTKSGRQMYAVGYDDETARLTGLPVDRLGVIAFVTSASVAGFAGMVVAARVSAGDPTIGPLYLIPAFSAAFLGATQFRSGRFNPWGTILAVLLIGTANFGLLLVGGPTWTPELFEGAVLIAAVALSSGARGAFRTRFERLRALRRRSRELGTSPPPGSDGAAPVGNASASPGSGDPGE
jgi:ribose transport system permease protein